VEVALVQWPAEQDRREELRRAGQPRLLLVERGAPPIPTDELEDWIRLPADDLDLRVRVEALRRRTDNDAVAVPLLDDDGVLRVGDRWVSLPPVEARLTRALLERFGAVVSRDALGQAGCVSAGGCRRSASRSAPCDRGGTCSSAPTGVVRSPPPSSPAPSPPTARGACPWVEAAPPRTDARLACSYPG
jgi:hypothetical protein